MSNTPELERCSAETDRYAMPICAHRLPQEDEQLTVVQHPSISRAAELHTQPWPRMCSDAEGTSIVVSQLSGIYTIEDMR
jgi:hypothetical protein